MISIVLIATIDMVRGLQPPAARDYELKIENVCDWHLQEISVHGFAICRMYVRKALANAVLIKSSFYLIDHFSACHTYAHPSKVITLVKRGNPKASPYI